MDKKEIRKAVKAIKKALTADQRAEAASRAMAIVETLPQFIAAEHVLVYYSLPDELSTIAFIERWAGRKQLYLPRVNGDDLDILAYDAEKLHTGAFNIEEPDGSDLVPAERMQRGLRPAWQSYRAWQRLLRPPSAPHKRAKSRCGISMSDLRRFHTRRVRYSSRYSNHRQRHR